MAIAPVDTSFYADPASLNGLKREAASHSPDAIREAARQFESLFTNMMLKSMRSASMGDPLFGSDQADMYQDMFDEQMATQLSRGKGLGLADMLVRQLMGGGPGAAAGASSAGGAKPATGAGNTALNWPPQTQQDFVDALRPAATAAARELGVDPDTIIAHAALETGWGRSMPTGCERSAELQPVRHQGRRRLERRHGRERHARIRRRSHALRAGGISRLRLTGAVGE